METLASRLRFSTRVNCRGYLCGFRSGAFGLPAILLRLESCASFVSFIDSSLLEGV